MPAVASVLPYTDYFLLRSRRPGRSPPHRHGCGGAVFPRPRAKACVFTLGADGAYYHDGSGCTFTMPAFDIPVKCTCGCGDAFKRGLRSGTRQGFRCRIHRALRTGHGSAQCDRSRVAGRCRVLSSTHCISPGPPSPGSADVALACVTEQDGFLHFIPLAAHCVLLRWNPAASSRNLALRP